MTYEHRKHDGSLPIVGVQHLPRPEARRDPARTRRTDRATEAEKQSQLDRLADFQARHRDDAEAALDRLQAAALNGDNIFAALMDAVQHCSLGQISQAFFTVGGQYRRNV